MELHTLRTGVSNPLPRPSSKSGHDFSAPPALRPNGSAVGRHHSDRRSMALRAEMGRFPLPRLPRRQESRAAVQIRPLDDALLSGIGRGARGLAADEVRARRRDRGASWRCIFVRCAAATHPSRGEPRPQIGRGDARSVDPFRFIGWFRRTTARRQAPRRAPPAPGKLLQKLLRQASADPAVAVKQ